MISQSKDEEKGTEKVNGAQTVSTPSLGLLLPLMLDNGYKDIRSIILKYLMPKDLENLSLLSSFMVKSTQDGSEIQQYSNLFFASKKAYLEMTRAKRAEILKDHIMFWRYKNIAALVKFDPQVLSIRLGYTLNRWQDIIAERLLSPLEYAWLAGDENLIELFERLGEGHLNKSCYENKAILEEESKGMRNTLSEALNQYAEDENWGKFRPFWYAAPHWIYALSYFMYIRDIQSPDDATNLNVFSEVFRTAGVTVGEGRLHKDARWWAAQSAPCRCISVRITHLQNSHRSEPNITESTKFCQIL
jgi:hypothetical protein